MDKILKTLETIKVPTLSGYDANIPGTIISAVVAASDSVKTKKKERISHCRSVTDAICLGSVQSLQDYHKILESVVEVLFQLSSDPDSDIRLVASECLNRLVRTLKESQQPRLHMEIYKEIRRNQNAKTLRTALGVFAHISSQIKPQKCRAFFASLLPCFIQISKRTEEYLYENLADYFAAIFRSLGTFAQDQEIKLLCKEFMGNLSSTSAIIRRASASILVSISQNSKKPQIFLSRLIHDATGLLKPKLMEKSVPTIIGSMLCLRHSIPSLYGLLSNPQWRSKFDLQNIVAQLVQVYEMCIILCNHDDHNVVTTSLETLQQLLTDPIEPLVFSLTSPNGIENSIDNSATVVEPVNRHASIDSELETIEYPDDSPELLETENDIPKFRGFLLSSTGESRDSEDENVDMITLSRRNSDVVIVDDNFAVDSGSERRHSTDENYDGSATVTLQNFPEIQIGSLYERNPPVYYCARFLAYNFLLAGQKGSERSDGEVRISVKVLAVNCIVNLVKISPDVFFLALPHDLLQSSEDTHLVQRIEDIALYASHSDPLLRGSTYVLVGYVVNELLSQKNTINVEKDLEHWVAILKEGLMDSSNIGVKCAIAAVNCCLGRLWKRLEGVSFAEDLFSTSLLVVSNPYWLVKVDFIELLACIEWNLVRNSQIRRQQVLNILLEYLFDEDIRVRNAAVSSLARFIDGSSKTNSWNIERSGILCSQCITKCVNSKPELLQESHLCKLCRKPGASNSTTLENVLSKLFAASLSSDNKILFIGYQAAVAHLSEQYPPRLFHKSWHLKTRVADSGMLLGLYIDILRSSPFMYDINAHQSVLRISCSLFLASDAFEYSAGKGSSYDEGNPFSSSNANVSSSGTVLIQHIIAVLKLYQGLIDQCTSSSASRKLSTSPVISPVKKFSQKLEAEKKVTECEVDKKAKGPYFSATLCPVHMRKINESIVQAWRIYRCNLEAAATTKFISLVSTCLTTLGQIFSVIRPDYQGMSALIEDIMSVTNSVFGFCVVDSLKCIRKVLQSVFSGYNLENTIGATLNSDIKPRERFPLFLSPCQLLRFPREEKAATISRSSADVSALGAFIRQFEPAVVAGLRMYTTTSDTMIQVEVLRLLKQLIYGHVNYGLVDSNQVFLGFVIKQISFLEEGQVRNAPILVEEMFQFLTLLSHEHHVTKSFIDVPKILDLCDILVSSENGSIAGVKSLLPAVSDIIIKRYKTDRTNWDKKESSAQGEKLVQLLMKAIKIPDVLPAIWILLVGRQQYQEPHWRDNSNLIWQCIREALGNGSVEITTGDSFNYLLAILCSLSKDSIPPAEELLSEFQKQINMAKEVSRYQYSNWVCTVSAYWILLVRLAGSDDEATTDGLLGSMVIRLLIRVLETHRNAIGTDRIAPSDFVTHQFGTVVYSTLFLMQSESHEDLKSQLHSDSAAVEWMELLEEIKKFPNHEYILRMCCIDLLSGISYPRPEVLEEFLQLTVQPCDDFVTSALSLILNDLNDGDVPNVEEWVILAHFKQILQSIHTPVVKTFLSRLSKYRRGQFLEQVLHMIDGLHLNDELVKSILVCLKLTCDEFACETTVIGVGLLKHLKNPYLELDVSQFVCYTLNLIHTRKLLFTHKSRDALKSFIEVSAVPIRHPRLSLLANSVLGDTVAERVKVNKDMSSMIAQWCCEDISAIEGLALAKMLGSLKYTQIMNIFNQRKFNRRVLHCCFVHLRTLSVMDVVNSKDVISLFTSELRSGLMEKWALGVACADYVVETLDSWENVVSDDLKNDSGSEEWLLSQPDFLSVLPVMWDCLTAMLDLKKSVIISSVPEEKGCYNNFIPTKIFTISFQYISVSCSKQDGKTNIPLRQLRTFLKFASAAVSDPSFVSFFNVRDNPHHIFICIRSLRRLVNQLVMLFGIDWNFSKGNSDCYSEIDADCVEVLNDFDQLVDFVFQVRCGKVKVDHRIFEPLLSVISGLGRCELVNGWILISHLRWNPQASWKSQIFPPIEPIPLEILRSEHELLLQYIFKLNVFGVASKIQFEENWVIFLSVINLYVDENFQLQIVSAGLKALSMLLQQCVTIEYEDTPFNENLNRLILKIDEILDDVEPKLCKQISFPPLLSTAKKVTNNQHGVDVNSCIRFLTDLYTQWLQNPQGKMPLLLLSEVVKSIVVLSQYFEETSQFQWMNEVLLEVYKSFEKEDEMLWPHLLYGIFYSAAKIDLEAEQIANLAQILEGSMISSVANVAITSLKCGLVYLQTHPDSLPVLSVLAPYALKLTQLDETSKDAESHSYEVWKLLLFIWVHGPQEGFGVNDYEQETLRNILTVLSPLNKAYVSVRLLVLKALRKKVMTSEFKKSEVRKKITKVAYEMLTTSNISIFTEALKLYTTIFYVDFYQFRSLPDPDPEVLMPMAERTEILFHLLKSGNKCNNQSVSKVLSMFILDFMPPSEILNRVIAEFMSPSQTAPELLAPVLAQVFEKARRKPKEAALVREWILAGLPNFLNSADVARTMWSLTLFFIGVSSTPEVATLLSFACLRRRTPQIQHLFIHSALDLYGTLDDSRRKDFRSTLSRNVDATESSPFSYLNELLNKFDDQAKYWEIDNCSP